MSFCLYLFCILFPNNLVANIFLPGEKGIYLDIRPPFLFYKLGKFRPPPSFFFLTGVGGARSTKTAHIVVSSPTRDVGLTPESPCAGQNPGTYRTRSGRAVIRPARFTALFPPLLFVRLRECLFQATDVKQGLFNFTF